MPIIGRDNLNVPRRAQRVQSPDAEPTEPGTGRIFADSANTFVTSLLAAGASIVLGIITARALGPAGKGAVDLAAAAALLAALTLGLSLSSGITYQVARGAVPAARVPVLGAVAAALLGVVAFALLASFRDLLIAAHVVPESGIELLALAAALAAATFYQGMTRAALAGSQRIKLANSLDLVGRLLSVVVGLGAAAALRSPEAFVGVLITGAGVSAALQTIALRLGPLPSRVQATSILRYSLPSYGANLLQFLNYRVDLFVVAVFWGPADVGLYAVAGSLVQLIWIIYRSAAAVIFPVFAAGEIDAVALARLASAARIATALAVLASVMLGVGATVALPLVYGPAFEDALPALLLLIPGAIALTPAGVVAAFFLASGRPRLNLLISGGAFLVTLFSDLLLIPSFGIVGAAAASSLSYISTLTLTVIYLRRRYGLGLKALLVPSRGDGRQLLLSARAMLSRVVRPSLR